MMKGKIIIAAMGLVLLLLTIGGEAELCESRSNSWKGRCFHNINCASACVSEGSAGGYCKGKLVRECMCTKDCDRGGGGGGGDDDNPPTAPPKGGTTPAPKVGSPPPASGGVLPPPAGVLPPPAGVLPPPAIILPPPAAVLPPPAAVLPPPAIVLPPHVARALLRV